MYYCLNYKETSILPNTNVKQETSDLLSSDDENTEVAATNVDCDAIDHASCQNADPENSITKKMMSMNKTFQVLY